MKRNQNGISAIGYIILTEILQFVFIVLKLCGAVDWSWMLVLSPTWVMAALLTILVIIALIAVAFDEDRENDLHNRR